MSSLIRALGLVFWVAASLFVASLVLSDVVAGTLGDKGYRVVNAALLAVVVICSGAMTSYEFGRNPLSETERGEWTNRQLFYAIVFTISFFLALWFIPAAIF